MKPVVVFIIPTRNRERLLRRAIGSVLSQRGVWRAIIVNDGSTDHTPAYLSKLQEGDARFTIVTNEVSGGVNAARNAAFRLLKPGEWALPLDDDDELLPDALHIVALRVSGLREAIPIVFFNTEIVQPNTQFIGGYQFCEGGTFYDPTYVEVFSKRNLRGDCKPVISATLFAQGRFFSEDVNGFESEYFARAVRDGVRIRYYADVVMRIHQEHGHERLSDVAAVRDPASFVRVHTRMFTEHERLLFENPHIAQEKALAAAKVALRAKEYRAVRTFLFQWGVATGRVCLRVLQGSPLHFRE